MQKTLDKANVQTDESIISAATDKKGASCLANE